jgi:DNA-binding CsgD family transcriptional regulator/GGDEF domain-containing protein
VSSGVLDWVRRERILASVLDRSHDAIAILDADGTIMFTNAAWRAGAERVDASSPRAARGVNYLDVCDRSHASVVAEGIQSVLLGERPRFEMDYRCRSALEDTWYALDVSALGERGSGAIVTFADITARVLAGGINRRGDVDPVTLLATSIAGVTGLAQKLAFAQSYDSSLAVVTIGLSDLVDIGSRHGRRVRDDLVVHVVARVLHLTRSDDVMIRTSANRLMLFASVANAQGGEFLRDRIAEVLKASFLLGAAEISCDCVVEVISSDQFSTLDSLLRGVGAGSQVERSTAFGTFHDDGRPERGGGIENAVSSDDNDESGDVAMVVYSLVDGRVETANAAARSLFGLQALRPGELTVQDIEDPMEVRHTTAALAALSSGAADSYRAQRMLVTAESTLNVLTSVRRLLTSAGPLAVALAVPVRAGETVSSIGEDPFAIALVAGTLDAEGVVGSLSAPSSSTEAELVAELSRSLRLTVHPDDAERVDAMLVAMRTRGSASGSVRVLHSERGWMVCQCQLFVIDRRAGRDRSAEAHGVASGTYAFVLSADVSSKSMVDRIARLEDHIRRIGSEVQAADLEVAVPVSDLNVTAALDSFALTTRQRDIVERLAQGQRIPSIAADLFISRSTVRNHLSHVYQLVGVHSQHELLSVLRSS